MNLKKLKYYTQELYIYMKHSPVNLGVLGPNCSAKDENP